MNKTWIDFMNMDREMIFFIFFTIALVVSIVISAIILVLSIATKNFETKNRYFNCMLALQIICYIFDFLFILGYFQIIKPPVGGYFIRYAKMIYYISASFTAFCWFMYIEILMGAKFSSTRKKRLLIGIPIIISTITTIIISIITDLDKIIGNPLVSVSLMYIPSAYTIFAFIFAVILAVRAKTKPAKIKYIQLSIYPWVLMTSAILQVYIPQIPIICLSSVLLVLTLYISKTQSQVSTDALTGINNRSALVRYIGEYNQYNTTYVLMIDVDKFKLINDNFGHVEGDKALIVLANALKTSLMNIKEKSFLARYGGDEFIIIISSNEEFDVDSIVENIHNEIALTHSVTKKYKLAVSIGYSKFGKGDSIINVIEDADEKMYKIKASKKKKN